MNNCNDDDDDNDNQLDVIVNNNLYHLLENIFSIDSLCAF